jgi:hypothetical protein
MRSAALAQTEFTPVFDWRPPRSRRRALVSFILASIALHALCFYIFQIIYPPTVALLPPPARISIIKPDSEDGRVLWRWIEAEDPALSSTTQRPPNAVALEPPTPTHIPSFAGRQPALRELPPYQPDLSLPSARPPGPVPVPRASAAPQPSIVASRVVFPENEQTLGAPELPPARFQASRNEPPEAAEFRIAIGPHGDVRHCFLGASSQDPALDEQARNYLLRCRFPARGDQTSLRWTTATAEWGNDLATAERRAPQP